MRTRFVQTVLVQALFAAATLRAQPDRLPARIESANRVNLRGNIHPQALSLRDLGPVDSGFRLEGMTVHLAPSPVQQAALQTLLDQQQDPASPSYHKWLTPEQFADRFSASPNDVSRISGWLRDQGFVVDHAARGRNWIVFSGTAGQVEGAFQTRIHRFRGASQIHYANTAEPSLPASLAGIVSAIGGLHDFVPESQPLYTSSGSHFLAPDDLSIIYDIAPLYSAGLDGTGQTMVVVGESRPNLTDVQKFRTSFNLPRQTVKSVLVPGFPDPGNNASQIESALDIQWAGAIARNAQVVYVYSVSPFTALSYAVDQNLAPVITSSYSFGCEANLPAAFLTLFQLVAQQANAEGITWVNSAGDAGPAACDPNGSPVAQNGAGVRFPSSIPEVTAVGGTEFDDAGGRYWNATNDVNGASALSYIPEKAWNESAAQQHLEASTGGSSSFFFKPPWQSGPGVPADSFRNVPDLALSSSLHDGYFVYYNGVSVALGGTSAAAPVFAGMLVLLNQFLSAHGALQPGVGNVNPALYHLAQNAPTAFHDIVTGDNIVPCASGSPGCSFGSFGYTAGPGYDQVTGLGSPDLNLLVQQWTPQAAGVTSGRALIEVTANKNPVYQQPPDTLGNIWQVTLTLAEEAGVGATVTSFMIDGVQHVNFFSKTSIAPFGTTAVGVGFTRINPSGTVLFAFSGLDSTGASWTQNVVLPFLGLPPAPSVAGIANAASFQNSFAPGMQIAVFGDQLTDASPQSAAAVPLLGFMGRFSASINGISTPLYYVSPSQVNLQIPYETQPGPATLTVVSTDGAKTATYNFTVATSAPGIFTDGNGFTVPYRSGARGQTLILFITGDGLVTPSLTTGSTPSATTPVSALPAPRLPAKLTIGGVDTPIQFIGIPSGLVGVTQVNFQVPAGTPLGDQPVVITIGTVDSPPAKITITN